MELIEFLRTFDRQSLAQKVSQAAAKRAEIQSKFPESAWPTLPLNRYALGTETYKDSFCYWMEYGSRELGSIKGGSAEKHLIYRGEDGGWIYDRGAYGSEEAAWSAIRAGFVETLRLGHAQQFQEVDRISALVGGRVIRTKFLSIYFPSEILPIFSHSHLTHFLHALGVAIDESEERRSVTLNRKLWARLKQIPELAGWSGDELMGLLYQWDHPEGGQRLVKIAPGEGAEYWESDCLPQGIMVVGWGKVGDLNRFPSEDAFRAEFERCYGEGYNGHQGTITRKAREVWLLRSLRPGDLIAANRGTKEILAIGTVIEPGYRYDAERDEFQHTVTVTWDTSRCGSIEQVKRWVNITVEELKGDLKRTILALGAEKSAENTGNTSSPPIIPRPTMPTNVIYYGPPGTGKTYQLQQIQAQYTDLPAAKDRGAWLEKLVATAGWREVLAAALVDLGPSRVPQIRDHELVQAKSKQCASNKNIAQRIWGNLQRHTPPNVEMVQIAMRAEPFIFTKSATSVWSLLPDWQQTDDEAAKLAELYKKGLPERAEPVKRWRQVTFHPSFCYEDFVRGIRPVADAETGRSDFRLVDGVFKQICDEARANYPKRYALFIDEVNRGNIAKIFGELISLIEPDKRIELDADGRVTRGMTVQLPGSSNEAPEEDFGVPANLDLYATMNTADRSIALLDIALRRRFQFREIEPNYSLLGEIEGVSLHALLERINNRLELLLDRDRRIGHAYFIKAKSLAQLREVFRDQIIPLLQEYFFDDFSKVAMVLSGANGKSAFVGEEHLKSADLFSGGVAVGADRVRYLVTPAHNWTRDAFVEIYTSGQAASQQSDMTL